MQENNPEITKEIKPVIVEETTVQSTEEIKPEINEQKNNSKPLKMPAKFIFTMYSRRLGVIACNLSYFALSAILVGLLGLIIYPLLSIFNIIIAFCISVVTLGLIYLSGTKFQDLIIFKLETVNTYAEIFGKIAPILFYVLCGLSIASIVLMVIDRKNIPIPRLVVSCVFAVICILIIVLTLTGGIVWAM